MDERFRRHHVTVGWCRNTEHFWARCILAALRNRVLPAWYGSCFPYSENSLPRSNGCVWYRCGGTQSALTFDLTYPDHTTRREVRGAPAALFAALAAPLCPYSARTFSVKKACAGVGLHRGPSSHGSAGRIFSGCVRST